MFTPLCINKWIICLGPFLRAKVLVEKVEGDDFMEQINIKNKMQLVVSP